MLLHSIQRFHLCYWDPKWASVLVLAIPLPVCWLFYWGSIFRSRDLGPIYSCCYYKVTASMCYPNSVCVYASLCVCCKQNSYLYLFSLCCSYRHTIFFFKFYTDLQHLSSSLAVISGFFFPCVFNLFYLFLDSEKPGFYCQQLLFSVITYIHEFHILNPSHMTTHWVEYSL